MSLVDYAAAARKRVPGWQGVAWQPGLWLAWAVIIIALFAAVAPGLLTHYSPIEGIAGAQRLAPQAGHWLGTDQLGRDVYTRIVYGASHSLSAALAAVTMGLVAGTGLGVIAGAFAGRVESFLMRFVDVLLSIPSLLLSTPKLLGAAKRVENNVLVDTFTIWWRLTSSFVSLFIYIKVNCLISLSVVFT